MKGQGSLEYLVIIAGVLSVAAMVVFFMNTTSAQSTTQAIRSACMQATAECENFRMGNDMVECPHMCARACSDPRTGFDYMNKNLKIYDINNQELITCPSNSACGSCKVGQARGITNPNIAFLDDYFKLPLGEEHLLGNGMSIKYTIDPLVDQPDNIAFNFTLLTGSQNISQLIIVPSTYTLDDLNNYSKQDSLVMRTVQFDTPKESFVAGFDAIVFDTQSSYYTIYGWIHQTK